MAYEPQCTAALASPVNEKVTKVRADSSEGNLKHSEPYELGSSCGLIRSTHRPRKSSPGVAPKQIYQFLMQVRLLYPTIEVKLPKNGTMPTAILARKVSTSILSRCSKRRDYSMVFDEQDVPLPSQDVEVTTWWRSF